MTEIDVKRPAIRYRTNEMISPFAPIAAHRGPKQESRFAVFIQSSAGLTGLAKGYKGVAR